MRMSKRWTADVDVYDSESYELYLYDAVKDAAAEWCLYLHCIFINILQADI